MMGLRMYKLDERPKLAMLNKLLKAVEEDDDVLAVVLFGSAARGEHARDLDVCLVLDPERIDGLNMAKKGLKYLLKFDLDLHLYQELPLYIQVRVLKEGQILLVKDEDKLYDVAIRTSQLFDRFQPRYERYLEGVLHG